MHRFAWAHQSFDPIRAADILDWIAGDIGDLKLGPTNSRPRGGPFELCSMNKSPAAGIVVAGQLGEERGLVRLPLTVSIISPAARSWRLGACCARGRRRRGCPRRGRSAARARAARVRCYQTERSPAISASQSSSFGRRKSGWHDLHMPTCDIVPWPFQHANSHT